MPKRLTTLEEKFRRFRLTQEARREPTEADRRQMVPKDHIHTYVKLQTYEANGTREHKLVFGEKGWKCKDPDCSHTAPYSLVIGKRSLCCVCGQPFILSRKSMSRTEPRCIGCSNTMEGKAFRAGKEAVGELMADITGLVEERK